VREERASVRDTQESQHTTTAHTTHSTPPSVYGFVRQEEEITWKIRGSHSLTLSLPPSLVVYSLIYIHNFYLIHTHIHMVGVRRCSGRRLDN
jgi:hypothetical protein